MLDTLSATWLLCLFNDSEMSRWMSIFGWSWLGTFVSGVNNVTDDFGAGSCPSGTQLSPQDSCLGYPPCPES